jgi:hypothetical protein
MLPGSATLTVHSRPLVGWNTAVGFEVSIAEESLDTVECPVGEGLSAPLECTCDSDRRFRF